MMMMMMALRSSPCGLAHIELPTAGCPYGRLSSNTHGLWRLATHSSGDQRAGGFCNAVASIVTGNQGSAKVGSLHTKFCTEPAPSRSRAAP